MIGKRKQRNFKEEETGSVSMGAKKLNTGLREDSISLLPEDVLGNILSRLPTKLAASTSILSKRWRTLFALVHNLDFDDSVFVKPVQSDDDTLECFKDFVDRTLALQGGSPIKKFSLKFQNYDDTPGELESVSRWIINVVERGVLEMHICTWEDELPRELYRSKTLVKLTLGKQKCELFRLDVHLPALKILIVDSVWFEYLYFCDVLLPGCPMLEELFILNVDFDITVAPYCICSQSIKKLRIYYVDERMVSTSIVSMSLNSPNLLSLDYTDVVKTEYIQVNMPSLVEAKLDLTYSDHIHRPDITNFIIGISNVHTLHLSPKTVNAISRFCKDGLLLPVFNNLVNLSFGSSNKKSWKLLSNLLKHTPNLETLTIQSLNGYRDDLSLRLFQVKVLHILGYGNTAEEMKHLMNLVWVTKCLELVKVEIEKSVLVDDDDKVLGSLRSILEIAAPKCNIKLELSHFI